MNKFRLNSKRRVIAKIVYGVGVLASMWALSLVPLAMAREEPFAASRDAVKLDPQIDWSAARLIAVQDANRYKTLDSFARESMAAMYGKDHLPGLSPLASLMEWLFNRDAYADTPVIKVAERGLQIHFTSQMTEAVRQRVAQTSLMTPHELADPTVVARMDELEGRA